MSIGTALPSIRKQIITSQGQEAIAGFRDKELFDISYGADAVFAFAPSRGNPLRLETITTTENNKKYTVTKAIVSEHTAGFWLFYCKE